MVQQKVRYQLAVCARALALFGMTDLNQGQVSARLGDHILIKNAREGFEECTPETFVVVPLYVTDHGSPSGTPHETVMHTAIYRQRPDIGAVVHHHGAETLLLGCTDLEMSPLSHDGALLQGRIARFTQTGNTVIDERTATAVAGAIGDGVALLLRNHGTIVTDRSVPAVCVTAYALERSAMLTLKGAGIGTQLFSSGTQEAETKRDFIFSQSAIRHYWAYIARTVEREWPEVVDWREGVRNPGPRSIQAFPIASDGSGE